MTAEPNAAADARAAEGPAAARSARLDGHYLASLRGRRPVLAAWLAPSGPITWGSRLAAGEREAIRTMAHQLRGSGGGYGFPGITERAAAVEEAVLAADVDGRSDVIAVLLADLLAELDQAIEVLERRVTSPGSG